MSRDDVYRAQFIGHALLGMPETATLSTSSESFEFDFPNGLLIPDYQLTRVRITQKSVYAGHFTVWTTEGLGIRLTKAQTVPKRTPEPQWFPMPEDVARGFYTDERFEDLRRRSAGLA